MNLGIAVSVRTVAKLGRATAWHTEDQTFQQALQTLIHIEITL
jgi:hypothetical protein